MATRSVYLEDVPFDEAWRSFRSALEGVRRWEAGKGESVPLDEALGRVTAEPIWAKISSPHYHAAAMDGFALRAADSFEASDRSPSQLSKEQIEYVDTGDALPDWADAVVPIEAVEIVGDRETAASILLRAAIHPWSNVRAMGEDMVATEMILPAGHQLRPVDLGAAAGSGHDQLVVRKKPRVAVIPTGSELVPPGTIPEPGQIIEYNSLVLAAQLENWGAAPTRLPVVRDNLEEIRTVVNKAAGEFDLILLNAGSSAGSEDHSAAVVESLGELLVHGVAIRPGHPVILGMINGELPIIGVPGYPASAALTGEIFVQPLIRRWLGLPESDERQIEAVLTRKVHSSLGDDEYLRVSVGVVGDRTVAAPLSRGAGVITSLVRADGIVDIPAGVQGYAAGTHVQVRLYRSPEEIERTILAIGSHDLTLDLIAQQLATRGTRLSSASVGSLGGLVALGRGEAHVAGSHLLDPQTGEYNLSYIRKHLAETKVMVVGLVRRWQGLILGAGNPKGIENFEDLAREDVIFVNRQRGAGTRVLLDYQLAKQKLDPEVIHGYGREEFTHLAVAAAIATGRADCGMGIQAAAVALELDFLPLFSERYDLVIPKEHYHSRLLEPLLDILASDQFASEVNNLSGYELERPGEILAELG
jgi:molybdopterin molybdotransferase/putative molybdopterin biosynthesis protein